MPVSSGSGELWDFSQMDHTLNVDILMPNGLLLIIECLRDYNLRTIKELAWNEAKRYPLQNLLRKSTEYIFVIVTQEGVKEEVYDESRRLCDLHLFQAVLKLLEHVGNRDEKELDASIGLIIGKNLSDFDESKDPELIHARLHFLHVVEQTVEAKKLCADDGLMCDFVDDTPDGGIKRSGDFTLDIVLSENDVDNFLRTKVDASAEDCPIDVIRKISTRAQIKTLQSFDKAEDYVLKVVGRQLYFLQEIPLLNYAYIQTTLRRKQMPELQLKPRNSLTAGPTNKWNFLTPSFNKRHYLPVRTGKYPSTPPKSLWDIDRMFELKVISASSINLSDFDEIFVEIGIFHGPDILDKRKTSPVPCKKPRWNETVSFQVYVKDIPHTAQICFAICATKKKKQKQETAESYPLAWANLRLIDFSGRLISDNVSLHLWRYPKGFQGVLNPLGHNNSNPEHDTACLEVSFEHYDADVFFPDRAKIDELVHFLHASYALPLSQQKFKLPTPISAVTCDEKALVCDVLKRDALHEMSEQEKEIIWRLREYCKVHPDSLPRLLDATNFKCRDDAAQILVLLDTWPTKIRFETSLELLDVKYPNKAVRSFAVNCLQKNTSDEKLYLYLMYLIQVLKYEPFMENDLSKFLLQRALKNRRIGHLFFWLIKSEAAYTVSNHRFHLLLEAYCRGCGNYLKSLDRQVKACEKLSTLNCIIKDCKDDVNKFLCQRLKEPDYMDALQLFDNPLDNSVLLGELMPDQCRVMNSAKRPLWLVWKNAEHTKGVSEVLFKTGDDLRQDMLTLHVMKIMETIWSNEGENFHLTPYKCLPMGKHIGMIEVVKQSKTILEIQAVHGKLSLFSNLYSNLLHEWIRQNSCNYEKAIEMFTLSCAGYCVATFVLGIGDRHSSNIMMSEDGKIFHIDFGHFLGHYKQKFGIRRERVPFVLTSDFLCVIAKGADYPLKTKEYKHFQTSCKKAYKILHKHAPWFITLFTMMLCMDLPELQRLQDIHYLRRTLAVDKDSEIPALFCQPVHLNCVKQVKMNQEKLRQLQVQEAKNRIGGKGTARRKKKIIHKTATTDDKKLQTNLKKLNITNISGIEEVNMIKDDGTVLHLNNPKVQASVPSNTFAIVGHAETKQITDMLPGILNQLGAESLTHLKKLASNVGTLSKVVQSAIAEDDEDVPDLVGNFDEPSNLETVTNENISP